jgi:hypothetical protein
MPVPPHPGPALVGTQQAHAAERRSEAEGVAAHYRAQERAREERETRGPGAGHLIAGQSATGHARPTFNVLVCLPDSLASGRGQWGGIPTKVTNPLKRDAVRR